MLATLALSAAMEAALACGAVAGDLGTTELALSRGLTEANVLVRSRGLRIGLGAGQCAGLMLLASKHPTRRLPARLTFLARALAIFWNIYQLHLDKSPNRPRL